MSHVVAIKEDGTIMGFGLNEFLIPSIIAANTMTGFASSDFYKLTEQSSLKEGFKVEVPATNISAVTNSDGYYEISNVPANPEGYTIRISKPGYLSRNIKNVMVDIGSANSPVALWAGDINQDNSINMVDVVEIAKAFNTTSTNENFNSVCDLNKDNVINLIDFIILAKYFNQTTGSYPSIAI